MRFRAGASRLRPRGARWRTALPACRTPSQSRLSQTRRKTAASTGRGPDSPRACKEIRQLPCPPPCAPMRGRTDALDGRVIGQGMASLAVRSSPAIASPYDGLHDSPRARMRTEPPPSVHEGRLGIVKSNAHLAESGGYRGAAKSSRAARGARGRAKHQCRLTRVRSVA